MRTPRSLMTFCSQTQQKRLLIFLSVVVWFAIFFVSGMLFVRRRYGTTDQYASLTSIFQKQVDKLSLDVNEHKKSAATIIRGVHEKMNQTMESLGNRIQELKKEILNNRQGASNALTALGETKLTAPAQAAPKPVTSATTSGSDMRSDASPGMCVDSMERSAGSHVELYACHSEGGNQQWSLTASGHINNKNLNYCLRGADISDGSHVITANCHDSDTLQKWKRSGQGFAVDGYSERCLDVDLTSKKLLIKICDSSKLTQHWVL